MTMKIDKALTKYKADRVVVYKNEKGKPLDEVDFIEHRDVVALPTPDGGIVVYDGEKLISYPGSRLYELVYSGESMDHMIKQTLVGIREMEKQIKLMEDFFEPRER